MGSRPMPFVEVADILRTGDAGIRAAPAEPRGARLAGQGCSPSSIPDMRGNVGRARRHPADRRQRRRSAARPPADRAGDAILATARDLVAHGIVSAAGGRKKGLGQRRRDWLCSASPANGAVAQLGERIVRNDEVRGSIPLSSTSRRYFLFGCESGSPRRAREDAAHEIALQRKEHDQRHDDRDERAGGEDLPIGAARAEQLTSLPVSTIGRPTFPGTPSRPEDRSTPRGTGRSQAMRSPAR